MKETEESASLLITLFLLGFVKFRLMLHNAKTLYGICIAHNNIYVDKETKLIKL